MDDSTVNILVYGDSLVWGMDPVTHLRLPRQNRWATVLQNELGDRFDVIAEGLRSRMFEGENPYKSELDGYAQYGPTLGSHMPLDIVIIMLGTNDCSLGANKTSRQIADSIPRYIAKTQQKSHHYGIKTPQMIFIAPPHINEAVDTDPRKRFQGGEQKSQQLGRLYEQAAQSNNAYFFNSATCIKASLADGIHLDAKSNQILGKEVAKYLRYAIIPSLR